MPAAPVYVDGSYAAPFAVTLPEFSAPFPQVNIDYVLTQDFVCDLSAFVPLALNTAHPDYGTFLLVREDAKRSLGAGKVQWTRTYAKVPDTWQTAQTINFTFPGMASLASDGPATGGARDPYAKTVVARIVNEYFLVAAGQTYTKPQDIPVFEIFSPYLSLWGVQSVVNILRNPLDVEGSTVPSIAEYLAIMAATPTSPDAEGKYEDELIAQDSIVNQWMGNIYQRTTAYIKAQ